MDKLLQKGVAFLRNCQLPDGSFMGYASSTITPFEATRQHPTCFFTALVAICCTQIPGTSTVRKNAVSFLLSERSADGSWNYWQRSSPHAKNYPYPDDLDDTACALLAVYATKPVAVDSRQQAQLARLLIASETQTGGPYRTWLTDGSDQRWNDVDIAVNANIGALLHQMQVTLPALEDYISDALRQSKLTSSYYVGDYATLYFLSKWYRGAQLQDLNTRVDAHLARASSLNSLQLALTISAARALGRDAKRIIAAQKLLRTQAKKDHWVAEALYIDPKIKGVQYYAGSEVLTTAFALEALAPFEQSDNKPVRKHRVPAIAQAKDDAKQLPPHLRKNYLAVLRQLTGGQHHPQITSIADEVASAFSLQIDKKVINACNLGSLNGWLAYTIYDDFLDDEGDPKMLGAANYSMRQALRYFRAALPDNEEFSDLVEDTFTRMDGANTWEVTHARFDPASSYKDVVLPTYKNYRQLADRSAGHMLASCGTLCAAGHAIKSKEVVALQKFFMHLIIAKQLNDDAHDWHEDLTRGHATAVVTQLLNNTPIPKTGAIQDNIPQLQEYFWRQTIHAVTKDILAHTRKAKQALHTIDVAEPERLFAMLLPLEAAAHEAGRQSIEAEEFIRTYDE